MSDSISNKTSSRFLKHIFFISSCYYILIIKCLTAFAKLKSNENCHQSGNWFLGTQSSFPGELVRRNRYSTQVKCTSLWKSLKVSDYCLVSPTCVEFTAIATKKIIFSVETHLLLSGFVKKQDCRYWCQDNSAIQAPLLWQIPSYS